MRSNANVGQNRSAGRSVTRAATFTVLEQLEGRRLMAASPFDFRNTPTFSPSSGDTGNIKDGPLAKGGAALVGLARDYTDYVRKGNDRYDYSSNSALAREYNVRGRDLLVTLRTRGSVDALVKEVKGYGGSIVYRSKGKRVVEAFVPLNQVQNLASRKEILHVRPQLRPVLDSRGSVANDAERSQKTEFVLPAFGVDGTGQTVGVISDSFGNGVEFDRNRNGLIEFNEFYPNRSQLTGDLPEVEVLADDIGTDEGRAMLELIHDLAPGADLAFHAVGTTVNTFADAIRNLREEAEATVIVDDIRFPDEPFFGEGVIDRAVNDVRDDGAVYLSSQGNYGFAGYSKEINWVDEEGADSVAADFDSGKGVDTKLDIHFNRAGLLNFQWDNAYDGVVADITADVDVYLYRDGTLISSSLDDNFVTGVPIERILVPEGGDYEMVIRLANSERGEPLPTMFKFAQRDDGLFDSRTDVEYPGYNSSTWGHSAARGNIPVGAVDNAASNAFGTARDLVSQDFSSGGPSVRVFDENGNRLPEPEVILTPLVSGIQGTSTSLPTFAPFFGTSASAPNVAAVAALLRQIDPEADPEDIKNALVESAKTNPLNRQEPGSYNQQSGYGLIDAVKAASILSPETPISKINVSPSNNGGSVGSIAVTFSEPVTGVDISDFTLTRDGSSRNRFTGSENVVSSNGGKTWTITNLKSATSTLAVYTLTLRNARTGIEDADDNVAAGDVVSFDVSMRRPGNLLADTLDDGKIRLRWTDTNSGESNYRIQRATDADFSEGIRNIDVPGGSTSYVDDDVTPGEVYYYRVRASRNGRLGDVARVAGIASSTGELFIDDKSAKLSGGWAKYGDDAAFLQGKSRASATRLEIDRPNTALFASDDIATGSYFIYTRYTTGKRNASNASYEILQDGEVMATVKVDQTKRGGGWVLLGKFVSESAGGLSVRLTSAGANGAVTADAVRFLPADEPTIDAFEKQKKARRKASAAAELT